MIKWIGLMNKKEQWYTTKLENFIASCKLDGIEYNSYKHKTLEELYAMYMKDEDNINPHKEQITDIVGEEKL